MSRKECALYWHTVNSICCLLLLLWFIEVKWNWICSTDGKLDFSVIFVIQLYLCCILYILCNHFYLILKTLYMEIFISCNFTCQLWSNVSNSWPVIVYLTKDCCVMEMKISYQKKIWLCLFVCGIQKCFMFECLSFTKMYHDENRWCLLLTNILTKYNFIYRQQWHISAEDLELTERK